MRRTKNFLAYAVITLLLFTVTACSNKVDQHISKTEDFIEKWDSKVSASALTDEQMKELEADRSELKSSEKALMQQGAESDASGEQMQKFDELQSKVRNIMSRAMSARQTDSWKN